MIWRRPRLTFLIALAVSLLAHSVLLIAVPVSAKGADSTPTEQTVNILLEPPEPPKPPDPPDQVNLGMDVPLPPSMTWLGFVDFLKHAGPLAEVEQAEFKSEPLGADSLQPAEQPAQPAEATEQTEVEEPEPQENENPSESPEQTEPVRAQTPPTEDPEGGKGIESEAQQTTPVEQFAETVMGELPPPQEGPTAAETVQWIQSIRESLEQALRESSKQKSDESSDAQAPSEMESAEAQQQPSPSPPGSGDSADKESDPSSIIEVPRDQWERGRPLATSGLELKPRKPHFTILTMITASPCNPVCEITFGKDGVPVRARLLSGSCDARVDEGILNSLYGWRASGAKLEALEQDQTVTIEIRLILNRRAGT